MNTQDYQYDKASHMSKEDELMMLKPVSDVASARDEQSKTSPKLASTPTKQEFMHQEQMKRIEMPKPFQL